MAIAAIEAPDVDQQVEAESFALDGHGTARSHRSQQHGGPISRHSPWPAARHELPQHTCNRQAAWVRNPTKSS